MNALRLWVRVLLVLVLIQAYVVYALWKYDSMLHAAGVTGWKSEKPLLEEP